VLGGAGDDTLTAGDPAVQLHGGAGADALRGGAGGDVLDGGAGDDRIVARSPAPDGDVVSCGEGADAFDVDRSDRVAGDCEGGRVDGVTVTRPRHLNQPPSASLGGVVQVMVPVSRRGRFALAVGCRSRAGACVVRVRALAKLARRTARVAHARLHIAPGTTSRVRMRVPARLLRALRHAGSGGVEGQVDLSVSNALGGRSHQRVAVRWSLAGKRAKSSRTSGGRA
jgi:hypothetical protein